MALGPSVVTLTPPLQFSWRSPFALTNAIAGDNALYGFNSAGEIVAVNGGSGAQRWVTGHQYVGGRISRTGSRLVAYRKNEGLTLIDDLGVSPNERVIISFGANESTTLSMPVLDEKMIYYAVNQGLYAVHQDMGLRFGTILSDAIPHAVALVSPGEIITVNGYGIPSRYQATGSAFSLRWNGEPHGVTTAQSWKTFIVANNRIIVGIEDHTFA
ncbi:MAG TPA: hypothetical protein VNT01_14085, partial [Symbiobacteriaceae bacterium]|nr:hypothetical protein [Symbiobacteriaceae bacterium]